jgi:hypothetical protein
MPWGEAVVGALQDAYAVAQGFEGPGDLGDHLYAQWYARPVGPVEDLGPWAAPVAGVCRAAHVAARRWSEDPLDVVGAGVAGVAVVAGARRRAVTRGEYVTVTGAPGLAPCATNTVRVVGRHGGQVLDGWWRTWGPEWDGLEAVEAGVSRVYLAPVGHEIGRLVHAVTRVLDGHGGEWAFKVGVDPATLARADGAVVYVPDPLLDTVLGPLLGAVRPFVRAGHPPLTDPLAPGISWAQDPGDGDSFGERTCRLVAVAAVGGDEPGFLDRLAEVFRAAGLDPREPHLRARMAGVLP